MGEPAAVPQKMTVDEFYDWSELQEAAYELVDGVPVPLYPEADEDGVVRATAAGTIDHHSVQGNAWGAIRQRLPSGCRVATGARLRVTEEQTHVPDVVVWCAETDKGARMIADPVILVEVLSPTTANVDKGQKLDEYQQLASVQEVWLVDSTRRWAKIHRRVEGGWFVTDAIGQGVFRSEALGGEVPLDELYADTPV